jgi:hypothetical protein
VVSWNVHITSFYCAVHAHTMPHDVHYQMRSKQLTSLSTFILYLQLGSTEGYYNPLPLFMHCPQCIIHPCIIEFSKIFKNMWVFYPHCIFMLPSSILRTVPGPLNLYNPYGLVLEIFEFPVQIAHWMHLKNAFLFHLNHIPINNMIIIMYIFL